MSIRKIPPSWSYKSSILTFPPCLAYQGCYVSGIYCSCSANLPHLPSWSQIYHQSQPRVSLSMVSLWLPIAPCKCLDSHCLSWSWRGASLVVQRVLVLSTTARPLIHEGCPRCGFVAGWTLEGVKRLVVTCQLYVNHVRSFVCNGTLRNKVQGTNLSNKTIHLPKLEQWHPGNRPRGRVSQLSRWCNPTRGSRVTQW